MAVQTVTVSTNVDAIASGAWRSNDTLVINNGAVVTVNTDQTKFWSGITINNGKLRIENTSTAAAIRFLMGRVSGVAAANITPANGLGSIEIEGNWIEIGTSDGTANQTFAVPYRDNVAAVWIEKTPGSGVYESWGNAGLPYGNLVGSPGNLVGLKAFGNARRGMVFEQTPNALQYQVFQFTNCSTTNTSRVIGVTSTTDITPGAWVSGTGIPANSVVEKVLGPTSLELNAAATATSGTVTVTIYPAIEVQLNAEIKFGDDIDGAIPPNGCKIRVPNIMFTHVAGTNLAPSLGTTTYITLTNSGSLSVDTALFDQAVGNYTSAERLSLKRLGCSCAPTLSKVYGLVIEDVVMAVRPFRNWWQTASPTLIGFDNTAGGAATNAQHTFPMSYITGVISDLYLLDLYRTANVIAGCSGLRLDYADELEVNRLRITYAHGNLTSNGGGGIALFYVNNSVFTDCELYGAAPFYLAFSSGNRLINTTYSHSVFNEGSATVPLTNNKCVVTHDPDTGEPLVAGDRYYLKPWPLWNDYYAEEYGAGWNEISFIPHQMSGLGVPTFGFQYLTTTSVQFFWSRLDPTHNSPAYELFRSTDPAVPVRDVTTRVATTNTTTTVTFTDSTLVAATIYYYVLRKYSSAGVYADTPPQRVNIGNNPAITNYCLQSDTPGNASWTKTNVTVSSQVWPYIAVYYADLRTTAAYALTATASGGTISQNVAGLNIGTVYTASVLVRREPTNAAGAVSTTANVRLTFGTAFTDFVVGGGAGQLLAVTFTATATSHTLTLTINTLGAVLTVQRFGVVNSSTSRLPHPTTTAAASNGGTWAPNAESTMYAFTGGGEQRHQGFGIPFGASLSFGYLALGSSAGFTPNKRSLALINAAMAIPVTITSSSNRNEFDGITQVGFGASYHRWAKLDASSSDNIIQNVSITIATAIRNGSVYYGLIDVSVDANRNTFRNFEISGNQPNFQYSPLIYTANTANGTVFEHINAEFSAAALWPYNTGTLMKGVTGSNGGPLPGTPTNPSWSIGSAINGMALGLTGVFDSHFAETWHSDTTGALFLLFTASTSPAPPYTLTGTAKFSNTGVLYFQAPGDSITYTWPHKIYGVSGFRNIAHKCLTTDLGASTDVLESLLLEFQIDSGSGYSAWAEATPAALSALSLSASAGFNLKLRLTARQFFKYSGQTNNFVVGETIRQLTSGATARVVADYDLGATGTCVVDTVVGTWTNTATLDIVRDSDSQARCTDTVLTNGFVLGPSFTSYINGLQIHTTVDQTVQYPSDPSTLTITGLPTGCDVVVLTAGTETILDQRDSLAGTSYSYTYFGTQTVDIGLIKPGYVPYYIRGLALGAGDSSIPVSLMLDRNYQ